MKNRILAGLTVAGVAILASCGQDITPTTSVPAAPSFARAPSCSFPSASNDAKAYFVDQKDAFFTALDAMQTAYRNDPATAVAPGFVALARIGVAANNGASLVKGTPAQGNTLVNDLLLCMPGSPTNINFTSALGPTGLFGVRTGGTSTAVIARNLDATTGLPAGGVPLYGAEPFSADNTVTATWPYTGPALFYGNQLGQSSIAGQQAAGILFDLKTLPVLSFTAPIRVGVCDVANTTARTLHRHTDLTKTTTVIVPPAGIPGFCTAPPPLTASRSFTQMVASLFTVKPLYAFAFGGGGAGLVGGLSEIGPVIFTDSLAFQGKIPNAAVSDSILAFDADSMTGQFSTPITVRAVSKGGKVPLAGVLLTLSVYNNSGSYTEAVPPYSTAITDTDGYARFRNYYIDKAGGYQVTVTSEFGTASAVTSKAFNISGQ
jgi:hypothetical protein